MLASRDSVYELLSASDLGGKSARRHASAMLAIDKPSDHIAVAFLPASMVPRASDSEDDVTSSPLAATNLSRVAVLRPQAG
jgi:hypothetical protein